MNVTERLAQFVACTPPEAIPPEARLQARRAVLDTLGVALAGCREEAPRIVAAMAREQGGAPEALVLGHSLRAPAAEAALANGVAAHALDFDDVSASMRGHPSAPLLPGLLALGERLGASGRELTEAFVLGFEVECKLGRAIGEAHYALGWHATSTFGSIGAAAACARLLRLDAGRTRNALGIAASLASGLRQNFGTMTKPLHAGRAAQNGVVAAQLAARGFTADALALEGESGFLRAAAGGAETGGEAVVRHLGAPWEIIEPGIGVKLYPCCYATHRAIDAALEARGGSDPALAIDAIAVSVTPGTLIPLLPRPPATGLEAKFSLEYCVVAALLDGRVGRDAFADAAVQRPPVRDVMSRVQIVEVGERMNFPIEGIAEVRVTTPAGEISARVETPRGDPKRPLSWDELAAKFRDCAAEVLPAGRVEKVIALIERLDGLPDVRELTAVLAT
ncbi:MAG: MmgE/PrpD family protein [Dehalococcoidia bacterium]|nr:MmgE/PrpD family protein [Dehalococcoidia bacterium]